MCGTATVSEALRFAGYKVIASDIMTFAVHHARVRLTMDRAPLFNDLDLGLYLDVLWELQSLRPIDGYIVREYSPAGCPEAGVAPRGYFTRENAGKIDAIREQILAWKEKGLLSEQDAVLLQHDLVLAANRVANIAGTYGHFRSKWSNGSLRPLTLKPTIFVRGYSVDHMILQGYAEELAPKLSADLCYLDPPYMKRQYAANYHLLETLARGDEPEAIGVSGLRPWRDQYSNFCSKIRIREAFASVIMQMNCTHFLISYSADGLLPAEELERFFSNFGQVVVKERAYPRFRSNSSPLGATVTEFLFHITKG
jgi:adenine-specific DNA-methyltransferase